MGQNTEGDFESGRLRSNIPSRLRSNVLSRAKAEAAFPLSKKGRWVSWEGLQCKNFDICEDQRIKNSKGHCKGCSYHGKGPVWWCASYTRPCLETEALTWSKKECLEGWSYREGLARLREASMKKHLGNIDNTLVILTAVWIFIKWCFWGTPDITITFSSGSLSAYHSSMIWELMKHRA